MAELRTEDLKGIEVFASGTYNGDSYTDADLDEMVAASRVVGFKPPIKIGHSAEQPLLEGAELPAAGWIENLRRIGSTLVADFKRVPKVIADLIRAGGFRRVSAEIYWGYRHGELQLPFVLKAVALLGGSIPAVTSLKDILSLYHTEPLPASGAPVHAYEFPARCFLDAPAGWYSAHDPNEIRAMTEAEVIALLRDEQPDKAEAAMLVTLWLQWTEGTSPTDQDFDSRLNAILGKASDLGWQPEKPAMMAAVAAGKEQQPMVDRSSQVVHERVLAYQRQHPELEYGEAYVRIATTAPDAVAGYLPVGEPKAAPLVAPALRGAPAEEVAARAKEYAAKHDLTINEATAAVLAADPALRKQYTSAPVSVRQHGMIAETEAETLLRSLSEAELLELCIERKLGEPNLAGVQQDAIAQISLYDWIVTTGGEEHGSVAAARRRDAMWKQIVLERYKRHGLQQPPGRG